MTLQEFIAWFDERVREWGRALAEEIDAFVQALKKHKAYIDFKLVIKRIAEFIESLEDKLSKKRTYRKYAAYRYFGLEGHYPIFSQGKAPRVIGTRMGGRRGTTIQKDFSNKRPGYTLAALAEAVTSPCHYKERPIGGRVVSKPPFPSVAGHAASLHSRGNRYAG